MLAERGEKRPPNDAMTTMNRFWFLVKTEWTGLAVETVASCTPWARGCSSRAVGALSSSPSLDDLWSVSVKGLSLDSFLEGGFPQTLAKESSLLRLPLGRVEVALPRGLGSVSFITTQLLVHLERATNVFAGKYTGRHHDLHFASPIAERASHPIAQRRVADGTKWRFVEENANC
jgi:hypothetical protein